MLALLFVLRLDGLILQISANKNQTKAVITCNFYNGRLRFIMVKLVLLIHISFICFEPYTTH